MIVWDTLKGQKEVPANVGKEEIVLNDHTQPEPVHLRQCFRDPIPELYEAVCLLDQAANAHLEGDHKLAAQFIKQADMPIIKEWIESIWGKASPYVHYRKIVDAPPVIPKKNRRHLRMPNAARKRALIERDGFHCRFCGLPVIRAEVRKELRKFYPQELRWEGTNKTQHAAFETLWLQYDHIVPHSRGGNNDLSNLVITCAACNYGRMSYLLEEVGLIDPFERNLIQSDWDGLERIFKEK